jgi:hypothetical protein
MWSASAERLAASPGFHQKAAPGRLREVQAQAVKEPPTVRATRPRWHSRGFLAQVEFCMGEWQAAYGSAVEASRPAALRVARPSESRRGLAAAPIHLGERDASSG